MKNKVAVVTDSTAYLQKEVCEKLGISVVPLNVVFSDKSYEEEFELTANEFYEKMAQEEHLPTTSQPAIGEFVNLFTRLAEEGYKEVITVHLSSKISGTYQGALSAGELVKGIDIYGFDSEISCAPQGYFVTEAAELAKEGLEASEIIKHLEQMKERMKAYFVVSDLKHLYRGGRLNSSQLVVGQLLKIKPILHFDEGLIVPFENIRTEKKAIARVLQLLEQDVSAGGHFDITVIHAKAEDKAEKLIKTIKERYDNIDISMSYFGPVIGTHLGEGSLGITWYKKQ